MSNPNLQSQQFFHGTTADIPIGGKILPGSQSGSRPHTGMEFSRPGEEHHAYATTNEDMAWNYAHSPGQTPGGRARVYSVTPDSETHSVPRDAANPNDEERRAVSWTVTGRRDTMPGHQGTLPLNWNQFSTGETIGDVNHPSPEDFNLNDKLQNMRSIT